MSAGSFGISKSLFFDIGEKQVSTVFKSLLSLGIVVLPSTEPVTIADSNPKFFFAYTLMLS